MKEALLKITLYLLVLISCTSSVLVNAASSSQCEWSNHSSAIKKQVIIYNQSRGEVDLNWIHPNGGDVYMMLIPSMESRTLSSYKGHQFRLTNRIKSRSRNENRNIHRCFRIDDADIQKIDYYGDTRKLSFSDLGSDFDSSKPPFKGTVYIQKLATDRLPLTRSSTSQLKHLGSLNKTLRQPSGGEANMLVQRFELVLTSAKNNANNPQSKANKKHSLSILVASTIDDDATDKLISTLRSMVEHIPFNIVEYTKQIEVHPGNDTFTANPLSSSFLLTQELTEEFKHRGYLFSALFHEFLHNALDKKYAYHDEWLAAQNADGSLISQHAAKAPYSEDLAESYWPYFMLRCFKNVLSAGTVSTIEKNISNRSAFFDKFIPAICT